MKEKKQSMTEYELRIELAALFRAMAHFGWEDLVYTHASVRIDEDRYLTQNFTEMFYEVCASSLIEVNMKKKMPKGQNIAGYSIHSTIYKHRPDVNCIIHTHTPAGIAASSDPRGLLMSSQPAFLMSGSVITLPYTGIINNEDEKKFLAEHVGQEQIYHVLMEHHGLMTMGDRIASAFLRMFRLEQACLAQTMMIEEPMSIHTHLVLEQRKVSEEQNYERPGMDYAWEAVKRLVTKKYPGFRA